MKHLAQLLLAACLSIIITTPVGAAAKTTDNFYFDSFTANYYLTKDANNVSHLKVSETLTPIFPDYDQNHGITRIIPRTNQNGANRTLFDTTVEVLRNNHPEPIANTEQGLESLTLHIGDKNKYVTGKQTYQLNYRFERVITDFDSYQELYWDTNGTGWPQTFNHLAATIHLDDDIAPHFTGETKCFVGESGSTNESDCITTTDQNTITFTTTRPLEPYENLTFVLKFQPNTFNIPPPDPTYTPLIFASTAAIISAIAFIVAIAKIRPTYHKNLKKYNSLPIPPQYQPPKNLSILLTSNFYSKVTPEQTLSAALIELAVQKRIRIIQKPTTQKLFQKSPSYQIEIINAARLSTENQALLAMYFGETALKAGAIKDIPKVATQASKQAKDALSETIEIKLFIKNFKSGAPNNYYTFIFICYLLSTFAVLAFVVSIMNSLGFKIVGLITTIILLFLYGIFIRIALFISNRAQKYFAWAPQGYELRNYLKGLEQYIKLAEQDRIKFHQSPDTIAKINLDNKRQVVKLYEKLLPYAIIFGLEKQWMRQLEVYYQEANISTPLWYAGIYHFNSKNLAGFTSTISGGSSSSSGFSGGSSGGGGGGGGGGGW